MTDSSRISTRPRRKTIYMLIGAAVFCLGVAAIASTVAGRHEAQPKIEKVDFSPVRGAVAPLRFRTIGFEFKCNECHRLFQNQPSRKQLVAQHTNLKLNHGSNDYCLNCHHSTNREAYVNHDGSEIPSDKPAQLCAKCHGPIYKDWQAGAHGKLSGTWNPAAPDATRLLCIQCHDPHSPQFPALVPMPGPAAGRVHSNGGDA